jgi:hypothetical protein
MSAGPQESMTDSTARQRVTSPSHPLPLGLADTIIAFQAGCDAKSAHVGGDVWPRIVDRFQAAYRDNERQWPRVADQVLTVARLAGRLAAIYAQLDDSFEVRWVHARFGLRDAQAECQAIFGARMRGKHCESVDLGKP